jgi:hypothetical protein
MVRFLLVVRLCGPTCDVPGCLLHVGYQAQTGLVLLTLSLAAVDVVDGARSRHRSAIE